eukprot:1183147-Prorocentrum_minimum.AAC.3
MRHVVVEVVEVELHEEAAERGALHGDRLEHAVHEVRALAEGLVCALQPVVPLRVRRVHVARVHRLQ